MATNAGKIWKFFKDKGLPEYGIAGLMGNLYYESALNPENLQNTYERSLGYSDSSYTKAVDSGSYKNFVYDSAGYGLAQWTYWSRKKKLLAYAKDKGASIGNLTMQCEFLYKELKDDYSGVFKVLQNAKSVKEASNKVLHSFERPANQSASVENTRASKGQEYYNKYKGTQGDDYESIPSGPVKILLVGNSYTYVNGVGQILSALCGKKSIEAVVVRATKGGRSSSELLNESLSYKCWVNGKSTSKGNGQLKTIVEKDFENLNRKGSWDFIVSQNNSTVDGTKTGDEKMFKFMVTDKKAVSGSKNFILHCTQFGGSLSKNRYNKHKEVADAKGCSLIDSRGIFSKYESEFSGHDWLKELTVMDDDKHQSARGAYLYACAIFAKLFGTSSFPSSKNGTGIGLYNSKGGNAQSFITDHWKGATSKASSLGNKISEDVAYDLQYLVSKYASTYVGSKLSRGTSSFVMTDATVELSDLVDLDKIYQYVITIDRNTKTKLDIKAIQRQLNVPAAMVEAGYLFDENHKRMDTFTNPKLKAQLTTLNDAKMPWGLYMISRARSQTEALEEINLFYYVLNEWTPRLGVWIVPEWTFTTKSINDKMLNAMYEKLKQFGFYAKMGLYATKKQIENISWKKHCEKWFLWWIYHTKVEEYKDEVITPEFFMLNDGKNNPQPVTILRKDSGDPYNPTDPGDNSYTNPDTKWKAKDGGNGTTVNYYNSNSDMLIIGDSRCVQMYNAKKNSSFTAVVGGHYGYGTYRIDSSTNMQKAKGSIKNISDAKGSVRIFVVATINDYTGGSGHSSALNYFISAANQVYDFAKNNNISAKIYCCSLIPEKGGNVSKFNDALKDKCSSSSKYSYLNINPGSVGYVDGVHFNSTTVAKIFKIMADKK